ncbi:MAG TPA: acyl-CoA desaturase [Trebonia sp.]|nr:acyl-CoA desaturase [Trebonia sp.]
MPVAPDVHAPAPPRSGTAAAQHRLLHRVVLGLFIGIPLAGLAAAVPVAWGRGLSWPDATIAVVMYLVSGHGITVGYHRLFTHRSFQAATWVRVALAIAGSLALQGRVTRWVADHRQHHRFSDRPGDPHSPWRYGTSIPALARGLLYAHVGWIIDSAHADERRYAPDLLADPAIARAGRLYPAWVAISLLLPPLAGGLATMSWPGAVTALFWATIVRVGLFHHVTWSINSICHVAGSKPLRTRDRAGNVWWLSLLSNGESWHNMHHADPTCARHGALRGQVDSSARVIQILERLGLAWDVRWPEASRLAARRAG